MFDEAFLGEQVCVVGLGRGLLGGVEEELVHVEEELPQSGGVRREGASAVVVRPGELREDVRFGLMIFAGHAPGDVEEGLAGELVQLGVRAGVPPGEVAEGRGGQRGGDNVRGERRGSGEGVRSRVLSSRVAGVG